jgi:ComF family protein
MAAMIHLARDLVEFVFPQLCPGCGDHADPGRLLCDDCLSRIPRLSYALCVRCLGRGRDPVACATHRDHRVWPAWIYDERAALVVQELKYRERPGLARSLGAELARVTPPSTGDLLLALPLHAARERERGYNQAAALAESLSEEIGVPRLPSAVRRVRSTRPQARLDARARRRNVAGAFRVEAAGLAGRHVIVVDDVVTTGATFEACFDALIEAGARPTGVALAWAQ